MGNGRNQVEGVELKNNLVIKLYKHLSIVEQINIFFK